MLTDKTKCRRCIGAALPSEWEQLGGVSRWKQHERWRARKQWKDTLREEAKRERDGSWQGRRTVCRSACIQSGRLRASSPSRRTQMHTQMHSDNPSLLAKCCLIQPDLHSTEKANSLPLRVWKKQSSLHINGSALNYPVCVGVCVCVLKECVCVGVHVCVCACWHVHVHVLTARVFYFCDDFFSVSVAGVYMYWCWQALQQYPLHCLTGR